MPTELCNVRDIAPNGVDVIYIGRALKRGKYDLPASPFANPFKVGRDGTIEIVLEKYALHVLQSAELMALLPSLAGKTLACWCFPNLCHGDVLIEFLTDLPAAMAAHQEVTGSPKSQND